MTNDERRKLYAALAAPFPEEAVERTEAAITGRGYDTAGIKYQYLADRLNEVLGVGGFRTDRTINVRAVTTAKGRPAYEAIAEILLELGEWIDGEFIPFAQAWGDGGHTAMTEADARKGAFTNGFKKAAAFVGPGREAYRGTIDDDHVPVEQDRAVAAARDVAEAPVRDTRHSRDGTAEPEQGPSLDQRPVSPAQPIRNRLTSKQYSALRSLARSTGHGDREFNESVRRRYGVEPGYLSRAQASELIDSLIAKSNSAARKAG